MFNVCVLSRKLKIVIFFVFSPGDLNLSTDLGSRVSSVQPPFSPSHNTRSSSHPHDIPSQGLSLTSPVLIAQSEHYLSPSKLRDIVASSDLANTTDKKLMHVAYGRAPLVIGSINVTSLTTYGECMKLVLPLVTEYVSTIAANESIHSELVSKYSLMDAKGQALTQEHLQVFCHVAWTSLTLFHAVTPTLNAAAARLARVLRAAGARAGRAPGQLGHTVKKRSTKLRQQFCSLFVR